MERGGGCSAGRGRGASSSCCFVPQIEFNRNAMSRLIESDVRSRGWILSGWDALSHCRFRYDSST